MKNILLVEDDAEIVKLLNLHFSPPSYMLTSCRYGKEAIDKVFTDVFHLIILDIMLPDFDGIEVCKRIREKILLPQS